MVGKFIKSKGQSGFTLVELMIVVAIIAILAVVAIPQFAKYRREAVKNKLKEFASTCARSIATNCAVAGSFNDTLNECVNKTGALNGKDIDFSVSGDCDYFDVTANTTYGGESINATCSYNATKTVVECQE